MTKRLGVIGTLVWDEIHGRSAGAGVEHEWGGVAYALAGLDAALDDGWEIVPLIKVGRDRAADARPLLSGLTHRAPDARFVETDAATARVTLYYDRGDRRCGGREGGTAPWTWAELGPMVGDLDALHVNFTTGGELALETAFLLRAGFRGPIYADLHSLVVADAAAPRAPGTPNWFRCFDAVQVNEEEMLRMHPDPMAMAAHVMAGGASLLLVTVGARGAIYVAAPGFDGWQDAPASMLQERNPAGAVRTALVPAPAADVADTTGCGDVFGAACMARLLAGAPLESAVREGNRLAARNAAYRGAADLARHLRGELVAP